MWLILAFHLKIGYKFCVKKLHDLSCAAEAGSLWVYLLWTEFFPYLHMKNAMDLLQKYCSSLALSWHYLNPIAKANVCVCVCVHLHDRPATIEAAVLPALHRCKSRRILVTSAELLRRDTCSGGQDLFHLIK